MFIQSIIHECVCMCLMLDIKPSYLPRQNPDVTPRIFFFFFFRQHAKGGTVLQLHPLPHAGPEVWLRGRRGKNAETRDAVPQGHHHGTCILCCDPCECLCNTRNVCVVCILWVCVCACVYAVCVCVVCVSVCVCVCVGCVSVMCVCVLGEG